MKKVLVAVDGSGPSKHALRFAVMLCRRMADEVVALRVINTPRLGHWIAVHQRMNLELEEEAQQILKDAEEVAKDHKVKLSTLVRRGFPDEEIIKTVNEDKEIFLVVLGSSGRGLTTRRMLGGVTEAVVREVSRSLPCPVVVVPAVDEMIRERLQFD
jgi:nucleotide-binding universal stress UspA family protein